jgi:hypothetical protein
MRLRSCFALLLIGVSSLACSSKSSKPKANNQPPSTGTDTGTDTNTNTDTDAGDPDAGGTNVNGNANCQPWPVEKLAPMIGPFFYGTDPRPCRIEIGNTNLFYTWDGTPRVTQMQNVAGAETTIYEYDDNGVIKDAVKTNSKGTTTTTYTYTSNATTWTTKDPTGATTTTVYKLDAKGYPTEVTVTPAPSGQPSRYVHEYDDNCRLTFRIAYNPDGSENTGQTAQYIYGSEDRVSERVATGDDEVIYYIDADGKCNKI